MVSSKLSGRRSTARKPPICATKVIPIIWSTTKAKLHVTWIQDEPPGNPIHLSFDATLEQIAPGSTLFVWDNPATIPNHLKHAELTAPYDGTYNALIFSGADDGGTLHYSENYFTPSQSVPFEAKFDCVSYDYPDPQILRAQITPVKT